MQETKEIFFRYMNTLDACNSEVIKNIYTKLTNRKIYLSKKNNNIIMRPTIFLFLNLSFTIIVKIIYIQIKKKKVIAILMHYYLYLCFGKVMAVGSSLIL